MKKFLTAGLIVAGMLCGSAAMAQDAARWIRKSCISPDGSRIAFSWQGEIFTVPVEGGDALQLTSHDAFDTEPLFTADGKSIVFASWREGSKDLWLMPAQGGTPKRLTTWTGAETPLVALKDGRVLFSSAIQEDPSWGGYPGDKQVWTVSTDGGRAMPFTAVTMCKADANADGVILYEDYKGYEDELRKHHVSSVTRDIWAYTPADGKYRRLSTFPGENREPAFAPDGRNFYFLCEQGGNFNVWKSSLDAPEKSVQLTSLPTHPVRGLSCAADGTLLFSWNGDLYTFREGGEPRKLDIRIRKDKQTRVRTRLNLSVGASSIALSPGGKEIAFIDRGEVYVTAVDFTNTKRITDTPSQERGVSFSSDGRTLYYAAERNGGWGIWKTELTDKNEKYFTFACTMEESRFTKEGETCFQPSVSPDGKWVAFLRDRTELVIKATKGGQEKSLLKGVNYSYTDGDLSFEWSPDSRFLLCDYMADGGWNNVDVALIEIENGKVTDLTRSGYNDEAFRWSLGGKAMTWQSDKQGFRSHGSWGAERDVYAMFFDAKAYADFLKDKDEAAIEKLLAGKEKKEKKDTSAKKEEKKLQLELEGRDDRIVRLTRYAGRMGDHYLNDEGTKLYYTVRLEKGFDLCCLDLKEGSVKVVQKGVSGNFVPSKDGKTLFIQSGRGITKLELASNKSTPLKFNAEVDIVPAEERSYIFEHIWKQVQEKFYDPGIHGIDWKGFHDNYVQFLPYIDNNFDFQELLSEMLGELNGSHTGARYYYRSTLLAGQVPGRIGVLFDMRYAGKGLRIAEVLPGGALHTADGEIGAGDLILAVNGKAIGADASWYEVFAGLGGKRTQLRVKKGGKTVDIVLTPGGAADEAELLYKRWVRSREALVEKVSGGRVGYVHVEGMNSASFREVYSKLLGRYRTCDAVVVDIRHNGGGWLHDDLATLLSGKPYVHFQPRGQYIGTEPFNKWTKPSCVLMCEDCYSDASGFPYAYRTLGIGKLIGTPVPGTMTAVWWERQIDATLVFGIPQVGSWGIKEGRYLENMQLEPDVLVVNDPAALVRGEDPQLVAAVEEMLKAVSK